MNLRQSTGGEGMAVLTWEILLKNREIGQITDLTPAIREVLRDLPLQFLGE